MTNPFLLEPFDEQHAASFFGRATEARRLADRVMSERIVLVHAETGFGKSSLVRAGVVKRLTDRGFTALKTVRPSDLCPPALRDNSPNGATPSNGNEISKALKRLLADMRATERSSALSGDDLIQALGGSKTRAHHLLVVDQLEEIFTGRVSADISEREFLQALGVLAARADLWLILVVRDDFLSRTLRYEQSFPGGLGALFWVPPLSPQVAHEIVVDTWKSSGVDVAQDTVEAILKEAIGDTRRARDTVVPLILQVVAHYHYKELHEQPTARDADSPQAAKLRAADRRIDGLGRYVNRLLRDAVDTNVPGSAPERDLRYWLENNLMASNVRRFAALPPKPPRGLDALRRSYLISDRTDDSGRVSIELSHDRFAMALSASNRDWFRRYTSPLWRDFADYRRRPRSHGRLVPFWTLYAGFRERKKLSDEEWKFLKSAAKPYVALAVLVAVSVVGLSLAGYWRHQEEQGAELMKESALEASSGMFDLLKQKSIREAILEAAISDKNSGELIRGSALRASQQAWFSALTLHNDELALAQALSAVALAKQLTPPDASGAEQPNGAERVFAAAQSALIGRVASDRFSRRRLLGKGSETGTLRFDGDKNVSNCGDWKRPVDEIWVASHPPEIKPQCPTPAAAQPMRWSIAGATLVPRNALNDGNGHLFCILDLAAATGRTIPVCFGALARLRVPEFSQPPDLASIDNVRSDVGSAIALTRRFENNGVWLGLTVLRTGIGYVWTVRKSLLEDCANDSAKTECDVLSMVLAERYVGGEPTDARVRVEAGQIKTEVLSKLGELTEVTRPRNLVVARLSAATWPAAMLDLGEGQALAATYANWCIGADCRIDADVHEFDSANAVFPKLLFGDADAPAASDVFAISRNGDEFMFHSAPGGFSNAVRTHKNLLKGDRLIAEATFLMKRSTAVVLRSAPSQPSDLAYLTIGPGSNHAEKFVSLGAADRALQGLKSKQATLLASDSEHFMVLTGPSASGEGESVVGCTVWSPNAEARSIEHCRLLVDRVAREIRAVAVSRALPNGSRLLAVGKSSGELALYSFDADPHATSPVHPVRTASLHSGPVVGLQWEAEQDAKTRVTLLSAGADGLLIESRLPSGDGSLSFDNGLNSFGPPMIVYRSPAPFVRLMQGGAYVYAGAIDGSFVRVEPKLDRLIQMACRTLGNTWHEFDPKDTDGVDLEKGRALCRSALAAE